jgi:hypothetical protein
MNPHAPAPVSARSLAALLCADPSLTAAECSRLCMRCGDVLAWFRLGVPRRHVLAALIAEVDDYDRLTPAARAAAVLDLAAALYPCP